MSSFPRALRLKHLPLTPRFSPRVLPSRAHGILRLASPQLARTLSTEERLKYAALLQKRNDGCSRTPHVSRRHNFADSLEDDLEEDGHRTWGFVIYRCTYKSDSDWDEFMRRLRVYTEKDMELYCGLDMMERFTLTVFDDKAIFDGATTSFVREHFKKWAATAPLEEQGTHPRNAQRYRYCVQVTDECLDSIIRTAPPPEEEAVNREGFVNIIDASWEPYSPWEGGERLELDEEPLEDCTLLDVGWMRVLYDGVMTESYYYLRNQGAWDHEYRRPPQIVGVVEV